MTGNRIALIKEHARHHPKDDDRVVLLAEIERLREGLTRLASPEAMTATGNLVATEEQTVRMFYAAVVLDGVTTTPQIDLLAKRYPVDDLMRIFMRFKGDPLGWHYAETENWPEAVARAVNKSLARADGQPWELGWVAQDNKLSPVISSTDLTETTMAYIYLRLAYPTRANLPR